METYPFEMTGVVKEQELDMLGNVSHITITEWLHDARCQTLKHVRPSAYEAALAQGYVPVVVHLTLDLSESLKRDDAYQVDVKLRRKGPRHIFESEIHRVRDNVLAAAGTAELVFTKDGRPVKENVLEL